MFSNTGNYFGVKTVIVSITSCAPDFMLFPNLNNSSQASFRKTILLQRSSFFLFLPTTLNYGFFYPTVKERTKLRKHFNRNSFMVYMDTFVAGSINKLANNIIESDNHISNDCYSCPTMQNLLPRVRTNWSFTVFHSYEVCWWKSHWSLFS